MGGGGIWVYTNFTATIRQETILKSLFQWFCTCCCDLILQQSKVERLKVSNYS